MLILNKPYVSDFLIETIKKNNFKVLDNEIARQYLQQQYLLSTPQALEEYKKDNLLYMNSENSIDWVNSNLKNLDINRMIELSKNKVLFRQKIREVYPNYYFEEVPLNEIKNINPDKIKYPIILKPAIGFLSFGVYSIDNKTQWVETIQKLHSDIEKFKGIFPIEVVNTTNFIIEERIDGDEFAIDAYFDKNGEAVILNIFQHPFFDGKDVSDRAYYTSKTILEKYLTKFQNVLNKIGNVAQYKNFPFHLELRANKKDVVPIEVNPMRFCGWCITDIANWTWNINVYEYFFNNKKPNWENILKNSDDAYYYFTIGDIPSNIDRQKIISIDFDAYLKNISNPLVIRKIDYTVNTVFAIVFAKTNDINEIKKILELKMNRYIKTT